MRLINVIFSWRWILKTCTIDLQGRKKKFVAYKIWSWVVMTNCRTWNDRYREREFELSVRNWAHTYDNPVARQLYKTRVARQPCCVQWARRSRRETRRTWPSDQCLQRKCNCFPRTHVRDTAPRGRSGQNRVPLANACLFWRLFGCGHMLHTHHMTCGMFDLARGLWKRLERGRYVRLRCSSGLPPAGNKAVPDEPTYTAIRSSLWWPSDSLSAKSSQYRAGFTETYCPLERPQISGVSRREDNLGCKRASPIARESLSRY